MFRLFESIVRPFFPEPPEQPPSQLGAFIWHYARPFRWLFLASIFVSMLIALVEVSAFSLVGSIVDWMSGTTPQSFWSEYGVQVGLICLLMAVIWPLLTLIDDLIIPNGIMGNMAMSIRWRGHRYLLRQSTSFYAEDFAGRIATKLMQTATGVRDVVVKACNLGVYIITYFLSSVVLFASHDWRLMLPLLIWVAVYVFLLMTFLPRLKKWSALQSDARSNLTGRVVDAYTNIQTVKMFASSDAEESYVKDGMQNMLGTVYPQMRVVTTMSFCLNLLNGNLIAGIIGVGAWLWTQDAISSGTLAFAATMALRMQGLSHYFLWEMANMFENLGAAEDGMGTLSRPHQIADVPGARPLLPQGGDVRFDKVTFHYGSARQIIPQLDLHIRPGEKVGLVGRSGAGKSTLVNLLLRLYDVEDGRITIDGQDIAGVTQESLRQSIAVVTQDTSLLHRSIRENIAYGRPSAAEADIIGAAKRAEAWDFIQTLEDRKGRTGLDAHVGERGVKLSGGQRQRIAIARVILKDAPILVLDEATSALDSEVESAIQSRLDDLMAGKTVVAIAHRLSTIAAMDRLIVLDQGQIVESGTHEALIAQNGLYASLWARQSGGFLPDSDGA
ncbi:ABC transporter ATP-binding protein [Parvularcula sp. LCG005]|uniref:ABC transporter ATP-binding protein n=1 Tax=Parvularcula sp. LCG005 TaxID=3078805 RepID=UPI00294381E7|nr:ABC transporter ATP-binding protein [Parvularcula sp. LCG005]WOI54748.1 ABC transporter ATP-binding protein [Parvularcula sp. LCG005]